MTLEMCDQGKPLLGVQHTYSKQGHSLLKTANSDGGRGSEAEPRNFLK